MKTIDRIIVMLDKREIVPARMMKELGFSNGLFSQWKSGTQNPSAEKIVRIADYLGCSVDYLLGRTDTPETSSENSTPSDTLESDFIRIFNDLSTEDKIRVLYQAVKLKNKDKK